MLGGMLGVWLAAALGCGHGAEVVAIPQPMAWDRTLVMPSEQILVPAGADLEVAEWICKLKTACAWRDREHAAKALAGVCWKAHPEAAYALVDSLRSDCHEEVREESARSLRLMKPCLPGVREALCTAAREDEDWQTRWAARRAAKVLANADTHQQPAWPGGRNSRWGLPTRAVLPPWGDASLFGSDPQAIPAIPAAPESYSPAGGIDGLPTPLPPPPTMVFPYVPGA
jgi:hypothetical protein